VLLNNVKFTSEYITVNERGHLQIEGLDSVDLADKFGTPLFATSENAIRSNYRQFYTAFRSRYPKVIVCASTKANNGLAVRRVFAQEGAGTDVFGFGELYVNLLAGVDPKKIVLNGSNKTEEDLTAAVEAGVLHVNVESLEELDTLDRMLGRLQKIQDICIRVKPSLHALDEMYYTDYRYSPPQISPSRWVREYKFGIDIETGAALEACRRALSMKNVRLVGLMYHGGVPRRASEYIYETQEIFDFAAELRRKLNWEPEFVNLGGGFTPFQAGEWYPKGLVPHSPDEYAEGIISAVRGKCKEHGLSEPTLLFEPGKYLNLNTAVLLGRVGIVKDYPGVKKWAHIDASTNNLPFVIAFHWYNHMIVANKANALPEEAVDIVGPLCNAADILGANRKLPKLARGDLIAVLDAGAYCESSEFTFNLYPRAAAVLVCGNNAAVVRERQTVQDLIALDKIPPWLLSR
jgi:diaminopimelate decarboxylase